MSRWFIARPVACVLFAFALILLGILAFVRLPIAVLPQVDYPNVNVNAALIGANAETTASRLATPLEQSLGRIAGVNEMTSTSTQGQTRINLQFDLSRNVEGALRDVQAALNSAQNQLPEGLINPPRYRKGNAGSGTILTLALTSSVLTQAQLYDLAFTVFSQRISQVKGVAQVSVNGSALRAIRIDINPQLLAYHQLSLAQVSQAITEHNQYLPTGFVEQHQQRWLIAVNGQSQQLQDYQQLIITWRKQQPIRLQDVATVEDSVQDLRNAGSSQGKPAILLGISNEPSANIVETVDAVKALLPQLKQAIPPTVNMDLVMDRSTTIRQSLDDIEHTLIVAIGLVVVVCFVFLANWRATLIASLAIPISLLTTLIVIYGLGFSLNNLSLMALIIATSFVVDDAIVVLENINRHLEAGETAWQAATKAVHEVGFTVLAMSLSLIAVFIPILFMQGMIGRLFAEFAVTLAITVLVSLVVALTIIPSLSAYLLTPTADKTSLITRLGAKFSLYYGHSLAKLLNAPRLMAVVFLATIALTVHLYQIIPKGLFPTQDTGRLQGSFQADAQVSFAQMRLKVQQLMHIVSQDPAIDTYYEYSGGFSGGQTNTGTMFARLKSRELRDVSASQVVDRLRPQLAKVAGANLNLNAQQELNIGARQGAGQYQYTLLASELKDLQQYAPKLRAQLAKLPEITDVNMDFQEKGLQQRLVIDRAALAQAQITMTQLDNTLAQAFGQRWLSTLYQPLNQYPVILTLAPPFRQTPENLQQLSIVNALGQHIPLAQLVSMGQQRVPLAINHDSGLLAATISFNLAQGVSLQQASQAIEQSFAKLNAPVSVQGRFAGSAKIFQEALANQPLLIGIALLSLYVILGMLYESLRHPLVILSTLPSAGLGALVALMLCKAEFSIVAMIAILLLMGIVMKNAIILVDCALQLEKQQCLSPQQAIYQACLLRLRPIAMTSLAAIFGALPLALGTGDGSELRQPLGIAIVGGLVVSQILSLYTTPIIYLWVNRITVPKFSFIRQFVHR